MVYWARADVIAARAHELEEEHVRERCGVWQRMPFALRRAAARQTSERPAAASIAK